MTTNHTPNGYPLEKQLTEICTSLSENNRLVLHAPPGAGKTTLVPLALLDEGWIDNRRIVMVEPRRLAARAAACRIAELLDEGVGKRVGYQIRGDRKISDATRIVVMTEGILTRHLQQSPELPDIACIIFDEFHERNLQTDLGLALTLEIQEALREDLRIVLMSATLDTEALTEKLAAPLVASKGRQFPVETHYTEKKIESHRITEATCAMIARAVRQHEDGLLAFFPGVGEIRKAEQLLKKQLTSTDIPVIPLYGNMSLQAQYDALHEITTSKRIVLATPIAESSLTLPHIRTVVDTGLVREPRFDPNSGMSGLFTTRASMASIDQRRGRAGREAPGHCYRLWPQRDELTRPTTITPEILSTDLTSLRLELACWGTADVHELFWLDPPPESAWNEATALLQQLGALSQDRIITAHGKHMLTIGIHPRLSHMLIQSCGKDKTLNKTACRVAALISERDFLKPKEREVTNADIEVRLDVLKQMADQKTPRAPNYTIDKRLARHINTQAEDLEKRLHQRKDDNNLLKPESVGGMLAIAYPDRIAQNRKPGSCNYLLANGKGAALSSPQELCKSDFLVIPTLNATNRNANIHLAASLRETEIIMLYGSRIKSMESVCWDTEQQRVIAQTRTYYDQLLLKSSPLPEPDSEACVKSMVEGIRQMGLQALPWDKHTDTLCHRMAFLHEQEPATWPDVSTATLLNNLEIWLAPFLTGCRSTKDLNNIDLTNALLNLLGWNQQQTLDKLAPARIGIPSGSQIALDYSQNPPVLAARIQQLFGLKETPRIHNGSVKVMIHLLSPAHRPVQVTQDIRNFWENTYTHVKKELKGKYPKHYWPDAPHQAIPTNRVRPD